MIFKLFKIFASNIFSFGSFFENFKKGGKGIAKGILLIFLFAYCFVAFGAMYVLSMIGTYNSLATMGMTQLMPVVAMLISIIFILFFGITSVATNYFTGSGEEQFLSMPITSTELFGAKFAVSFCTDALIGFALFAIASFIYGVNEHLLTNPLFYLGMIVSAVAVSVVAISVIYFILILLLTVCPGLRKKSFLTTIASILIFAFAFGYGILNSKLGSAMESSFEGNSSATSQLAAPIINSIGKYQEKLGFVRFLSSAMDGKILPILFMLAVCALVIFGLIPFMGKFYVKTLNGFSDIKTKKLTDKKADELIKSDVRSKSLFHALYMRDVRTVLREPTFFANGPLMVFLFPVILMISSGIGLFSAGADSLSKLTSSINALFVDVDSPQSKMIVYYATVIISGIILFCANSTSIASSSFSREGKALYDLKAMPIQNDVIVKVKFWHAISYVLIALVYTFVLIFIALAITGIHLPLSVVLSIVVQSCIFVLPISILIIFFEMFLDTMHPKLQWENPIAAFKQNVNSVVSVFFSMIMIAIVVLLSVFALPKNMTGVLIIGIIFAAISAPVGAAYFKYAKRRISQM